MLEENITVVCKKDEREILRARKYVVFVDKE